MADVHTVAARLDKTQSVAVIHKAHDLTAEHPVPDLSIVTHAALPDVVSLAQLHAICVADAEQFVNAIVKSLPGGTVDQILRLLLERRALDLVVTTEDLNREKKRHDE